MHLKPLRPAPGPILSYIAQLEEHERHDITRQIQAIFNDPSSAILMELLEKSVQDRNVSLNAPPGALEDLNAQRILVTDLQQIVRPNDAYLEPVHGGRALQRARSRTRD